MTNNTSNIFSEFSSFVSKTENYKYSSKTMKNTENIKTQKNNKLKTAALFSIPTIAGGITGIKISSSFSKKSKDILQKEKKELSGKLTEEFRNDKIAASIMEYINVLKTKINNTTADIQKTKDILNGLTIPYEREQFEGILTELETQYSNYSSELKKSSAEHRSRYDELITKPLKNFAENHVKKLEKTTKIIISSGLVCGALIGGMASYINSKKNKES